MARRADDRDEEGPERTCVATRRKGSPDDMLRFVLSPEATVTPDIRRRLPGRGVWVGATAADLAKAVKAKAFARAMKRAVTVPPDLVAIVDRLLEDDALASLAMANKAGLVVAGAGKVEGALAAGGVGVLLQASDGSADGLRKLEAAARRGRPEGGRTPPVVRIFASSQLDLALGRTNVIHASLAVGIASNAFALRAARLERFRSGSGLPAVPIDDRGQRPEGAADDDPEQGLRSGTSHDGPGPGMRDE